MWSYLLRTKQDGVTKKTSKQNIHLTYIEKEEARHPSE